MPFKFCAHRFLCFYCGCSFADCDKLKTHNRDEHSTVEYGNLIRTLPWKSVKMDVTELTCKLCPKSLETFDALLAHLEELHNVTFSEETRSLFQPFRLSEEKSTCPECGEDFKFFGALMMHINRVHLKKTTSRPFLCERCGEGFSSNLAVQRHAVNCHAGTLNYILHEQEKEHSPKKLKCPKCSQIFHSHYLLKGHLATSHDFKDYKLPCAVCKKTFIAKSRLDYHVRRVHLKERKFVCQDCGFKAFNGDHLKRHMVKHSDNRPFECDICKKSFQRKRTLDFHKRIHTNDKRYVCRICSRAFVQLTSLKLHNKVHHSSG